MNALCHPLGRTLATLPARPELGEDIAAPHSPLMGSPCPLPFCGPQSAPEHAGKFDDMVSGGAPAGLILVCNQGEKYVSQKLCFGKKSCSLLGKMALTRPP